MEKWLQAKTIATWFIVVFIVMVVLSSVLVKIIILSIKKQVENGLRESSMQLAYQRQLIETSITVQERERERIAADVHDALIGKLITLKLESQLKYKLNDIDIRLESCIAEARRISHDLSPPMLEFITLEDIVSDVIKKWKDHIFIEYHLSILMDLEVPDKLKLQIERILQELLTNIYKYSMSSVAMVQLRISGQGVALVVSDNGIGFDAQGKHFGLGLKNIELRVLFMEGKFKIKSSEMGTTIILAFGI